MIAVMVLVIVAVVFIIRKKKKDVDQADQVITGSSDTATGLPSASFPLRPRSGNYTASSGSYGKQIAELQKMCNEKYGTSLTVDGKFGPKTEKAFEEKFPVLLFPGEISLEHYNILMG